LIRCVFAVGLLQAAALAPLARLCDAPALGAAAPARRDDAARWTPRNMVPARNDVFRRASPELRILRRGFEDAARRARGRSRHARAAAEGLSRSTIPCAASPYAKPIRLATISRSSL